MIPKLLKIKGLYSYQTEQTIHFDNLTDASLFGIFGAVGSGKSSILEAMTFALYGDTERLNKSGDDRTYNMMNLRSDELWIDFECIAGKDGNRYKFTVKGKRNSKKFKEVKTFERKGYKWNQDDWLPLSDSETTESIIGLSYDNFRRTIIIPQGRFQEFIELKDSERSRMMKELFQLEKYDLSGKVAKLLTKNNIEISNVEGQLTSLGEITKEMIVEEEQKCSLIRTAIKSDQENLLLQTQLEETFNKQKLALDAIQKLKDQLIILEKQEPEMRQRTETLGMYENCVINFKPLFEQKVRFTNKLIKDQQDFEHTASLLKNLTDGLSIAKTEQTKIHEAYHQRENLIKQAEELEKLLQIFALNDQITKSSASFERGEVQLISKKEEVNSLKENKEKLDLEVTALKETLPDINEVAQLKSWYATTDSLIKQKESTREEANQVVKEINRLEAELLAQLKQLSEKYHFEISKTGLQTDFEACVLQKRQGFETQIKEYDSQLLEAQTKAKLQQFATELVDGKPCPLCGAEHHPSVLHASEDLAALLKNIKEQKYETQKRSEELILEQKPIDRLFQNIDHREKQKATIKLRWDAVKASIVEQDQRFIWEKFEKNNKQAFENYTKDLDVLQKTVKEKELLLKGIVKNVSEGELFIQEKLEKPLQKLRDEILAKKNEVSVLKRQLLNVNTETYTFADIQKIDTQIRTLKNTYSQLKIDFEKREKEIEQIEKQTNTLSGGQDALKQALENTRNELVLNQGQINTQLQTQQFESEIWVQQVLNKNLTIETERKQLRDYDLALNNVRRDLLHHESQNPAEKYDPQLHQETLLKKNQLTETLNSNRKEEGRLDGLIKKLRDDFENRTRLLTHKSALDVRQSHLTELARLFRSSGFVDYASSIYLQNLIQAANTRFHQMTHQQLHLELGEGNSFWVRDLLNGGHLRLLKTLSGGQKFQAALSLALALADHIHIRNESKHNFFFLDEGFGSLDRNALQTVFETLKSLRKEHRIVGIISHVEDLQQEIQTYLKIEESEEGSRIIESWA